MQISDQKIFSIQLKGALDGASSEDLLSYIKAQLELGYTRFLFNFNHVQFITSNGISTLIKIQKMMNENSGLSFVFYGLKEEVENVLNLLGLYKKLPIKKTLQDAEVYLRSVNVSTKITPSESRVMTPNTPSENLKFYYSGIPKGMSREDNLKVSSLEPISIKENQKTEIISEQLNKVETHVKEIPAMEKLLEDKLSSLRNEIKDALSQELEKRLSHVKVASTNLDEVRMGSLPSYIQTKNKKTDLNFEKIFPCEACGAKLRVKKVGAHQCPLCKTEVYVNTAGNTRFIEKFNS
ncbi:MAG: STAS domain-containing protein [Leptospira sp.]|nr:STAS domain-containing protein [Leptospira sp.]